MTQTERAEELAEAFEMFDAWEDRYRFLIDLGKGLPPLPEEARIEENRVHGCQSNVWMIARPATEETLDFVADSDSHIVRGLIAVLRTVYANETPQNILNFDMDAFLRRLELDQHLSMGRRNGLSGMVTRIKALATSQLSACQI